MTALLLCAVVAFAQAPAASRRAQTPAKRDTIYVAVQSPPPIVNVAAPSQGSTIALGVAGLVLLGLQLWIMARQTTLLDKQTTLLDQQAAWRRDEAVGTFYRVAHDLADEFRKANVMPGTPIPANYDTHPRQMLREAARLFAPLQIVSAVTEAAMFLDEYFSAVQAYNARPGGREGAARWQTVQAFREQVGRALDRAKGLIPDKLRWMFADGTEADFRRLCMMPANLAKAIMGGPDDEAAGPKDKDEAGS